MLYKNITYVILVKKDKTMATKITKEMIINAAFSLLKEGGFKAVNTRDIASLLNVSTQPIYSCYKSVGEMLEDLYKAAEGEFKHIIFENLDETDLLFSFSLSYIRAASEHKNLFRFLFFEYYKNALSKENLFIALKENLKNPSSLSSVLSLYKVDDACLSRVFTRLITYAHGEAAYTLVSEGALSEEKQGEIEDALRSTINEMIRGEIMRQNFGI